jgi:hypothetical protein
LFPCIFALVSNKLPGKSYKVGRLSTHKKLGRRPKGRQLKKFRSLLLAKLKKINLLFQLAASSQVSKSVFKPSDSL